MVDAQETQGVARGRLSPAELFALDYPGRAPAEVLGLSEPEERELARTWRGWWARPAQLAPLGKWTVWLICAGRGFGKSRSGAEWSQEQAVARPGSRGCFLAETPEQARDVMLEGESGLLEITRGCAREERPTYNPSKKLITWPNGSRVIVCSAFDYEALRGKQFHWAWVDELAKFEFIQEAWDQLMLCLRLPPHANCCVTTTPRALPLIKKIIADPYAVVSHGTTYENLAHLADNFKRAILSKYEGTRLGRQELNADILEDLEGALWSHAALDALRCDYPQPHELKRVVVAVDPSGGDGEGNDEQGIVVAGLTHSDQGIIMLDKTLKGSPAQWGEAAVRAAVAAQADCVAYESNFGGQMCEFVIRTAALALKETVRIVEVHASKGKVQRAEPVAALYEQGRVRHAGTFPALEDELCAFTPQGYMGGKSPNRADSAIWALTELMLGGQPASYEGVKDVAVPWGRRR